MSWRISGAVRGATSPPLSASELDDRLPAHELKGAAAAERTHERAKATRTSSEDEASAPGGELSMLRRKEKMIKRERATSDLSDYYLGVVVDRRTWVARLEL